MDYAEMLRQARLDAGITQDQLADKMQVTRKTVQNWENGISCPSLENAVLWFQALHLQPLPYFMAALHGNISDLSVRSSDKELKSALHTMIDELPEEAHRMLLYCSLYNHGSSPFSVLNLLTAYLQTPLRDRLGMAQLIVSNYELARMTDRVVAPGNIQPDVDILRRSIRSATKAVVSDLWEYSQIEAENEIETRDA